jgi:hypothetical protein
LLYLLSGGGIKVGFVHQPQAGQAGVARQRRHPFQVVPAEMLGSVTAKAARAPTRLVLPVPPLPLDTASSYLIHNVI